MRRGDHFVMKELSLDLDHVGVDVVPAMSKQNRVKYESPGKTFLVRDITRDTTTLSAANEDRRTSACLCTVFRRRFGSSMSNALRTRTCGRSLALWRIQELPLPETG